MPTPVIGFCQSEITLYGAGGIFPPATDIAPTVAGLVNIGATWVRVLADWRSLEPSVNSYSWSLMDAAMIALTNAGINVLVVPADPPNFQPTPMTFANFCTTAAQRYGPGGAVTLAIPVRYWELWNEPNSLFSAPPNNSGIPGMYAYTKAGYDAIKAVDPGAFILSAGLLPAPNGWFTTDAVTWLTGMYAAAPAGGPYPWDGVAFHPYSSTDNAGAQEPTATQVWIAEIPQLYQVMVANGDGAKPIWLTEFGFETQPSGVGGGILVTPAIQAQWLVQQINVMQTVADQAGITLGPMFPYNYRNSTPENSGSNGMGVVKFDFTPQPAWSAVRTLISGGAPIGVTSGRSVINLGATITAAGAGPNGVTVGGTVIPLGAAVTAGGTTVSTTTAANWAALGISLNPVSVPMNSFQNLADELVGEVGSSIADLTNVLTGIGAAAASAGQAANGAAGDLIALITGIVGDGEAALAALIASLNGTGSTAVVNTNQINALWAHVSAANTAGIRYLFSSSVALTANYQGTTNPAWSAAGPLSLPTVPSGKNYVESSSGTKGMVFTGNPTNAATGDHGLVTNRFQIYATLLEVAFGTTGLFGCGHYVSGTLGQNLMLQLGWGGPAALRFYVCTGANSGLTPVGVQWDLPSSPKVTDVVGFQGDGATPETFTMFYNNVPVGTPWTDTGGLLTRGAGYRDCGVIVADEGFGHPTFGWGEFVALDYA